MLEGMADMTLPPRTFRFQAAEQRARVTLDEISVLLHGAEGVLEEAEWVLRFFCGSVTRMTSLDELVSKHPQEDFDLLIFPESLSLHDRGRWTAASLLRWPRIQLLCLRSGEGISSPALLQKVMNALLGTTS